MEDLLTTKQLQEMLQVDRVTIYRMLKEGRLEGFKVGGQWRFSRQAIQQWLKEKQATLDHVVSPGAPGVDPEPRLLSLSCLQAIQDIFAEAVGVGAVTTSLEGAPLTTVSHACAFCQMILGTETGRQRCIDSWHEASAAAHAGPSSRRATCHAGLRYLSARIEVGGEGMAAVHAGQFLDVASRPIAGRREQLASLAAATGLEAEELEQAVAAVSRFDEEQLDKIARMLQRIARTLAEMAEERRSLVGRLQRIAQISQVS